MFYNYLGRFLQNQTTIFCVRCGTQRGVITHWLRAETHRDMAAWARSLVQGSHNAINFQREFSFRCMYQVCLCLRYEFAWNIINFIPIPGTTKSAHRPPRSRLFDAGCDAGTERQTHLVVCLWHAEEFGGRRTSYAFPEFRHRRWRCCEWFLCKYWSLCILTDFGMLQFYLQEIDMECCVKPIVFVLHNCLSAKVHSLVV